jgi:glycerol kinase
VQWLRDGLGIIERADHLESLAASCADTGGAVLVPAFTGLGSPWWDPHARGTIMGITRGTGRAQLARAVVESMVFQTRDVIEAMDAASGTPLAELRVDGGASAMDLMVQMQADQLRVPVVRAASLETTALGAAFLAGLAEGVWADPDALAATVEAGTRFEPADTRDDAAFDQWHRAVERSGALAG